MKRFARLLALAVVPAIFCSTAGSATATETENFGLSVLPGPGSVAIDGRSGDWDLTGGIFVCGDVESFRDTMSLWYHAMYDADNLYLLARWNDETPLNNPGVTSGDMGFNGDCLQTRVIVNFGQPDEKVTHLTCWRGKDGRDVIKVELGRTLHDGTITDLKTLGARQAFTVAEDGRHYTQEIAIPWSQLGGSGKSPGAGGELRLAIEANFSVGSNGRMTYKDCFQPGLTLDRVFTFRAVTQWGTAELLPKGNVAPRPVRLSDNRKFPVHMQDGAPVTDWTGLVQKSELASIKSIPFDMPEDGYASIVLKSADGAVVRHLANCEEFSQGHHALKWDGLSTPTWKQPGDPVPAGTYQAAAIYHKGIGMRLKGWAANSGQTPWDYPARTGNWGGDHGKPCCVTADKDHVYLGWEAAEAGKALVCCDLDGNVLWHHSRGGIGGARAIAVVGDTVYVLYHTAEVFRLDRESGQYNTWTGSDSTALELKDVFENFQASREDRFGMTGGAGKLYLSSKLAGQVVVLDPATGKVLQRLSVDKPTAVTVSPSGQLFVVSDATKVLAFPADLGSPKTVLQGLIEARGIAVDAAGQILVGIGEPDNQVKVFSPAGKLVKAIGRPGGRELLGLWTPDGMRFVDGIALDAAGKLWVMENDWTPKRQSVWNVETGKLVHEMFGVASYGAPGGAVCPDDPMVVVGQGCEWRIDPKTGLADCTAVITRAGMESSRFVTLPDGKTYLYVASTESGAVGPLHIFQRLGEGKYKLRTAMIYVDEAGKELPPSKHGKPSNCKQTVMWSDANDDGQRQAEEMHGIDGEMRVNGWFLWATPEGSLYSKDKQFKLLGLTACAAPRYDLTHPLEMPAAGLGSADGRLVMTFNREATERAWNRCFEIASGKLLWEYPDTYVGVHGSHNAPPPIDGLIRGAFPPCGTAKLPEPIGNIWVIPTNVGEWHILTEHGYYLTRLFQPDPLKVKWPEAKPGAVLDEAASGSGGEDFGGSVTQGRDGKVYLQAGKTAFWDIELVGLEAVKPIAMGTVTIDPADIPLATKIREDQLQTNAAKLPLLVKKQMPQFTGNLARDFPGAMTIKYQKQEEARVQSVAAWDDQNLYLGWEVFDSTPWVNGTTDRELMYIGGDTVDFQLATDPAADPKRADAERGDLRLSIGPFQKKTQAIVYCRIADEKHPRSFDSGVFHDYVMQSVLPLEGAELFEKTIGTDRYVVEAKVPLTALGLAPRAGLELRGDFGVTHGDPAGQRTRLRTYWSNQHTGIVDDAVAELKMEPRRWGTLQFAE